MRAAASSSPMSSGSSRAAVTIARCRPRSSAATSSADSTRPFLKASLPDAHAVREDGALGLVERQSRRSSCGASRAGRLRPARAHLGDLAPGSRRRSRPATARRCRGRPARGCARASASSKPAALEPLAGARHGSSGCRARRYRRRPTCSAACERRIVELGIVGQGDDGGARDRASCVASASSGQSPISVTPGKRASVAKARRGSTTVTSKPARAAIGASGCAICTAPTMIRRGGGLWTCRNRRLAAELDACRLRSASSAARGRGRAASASSARSPDRSCRHRPAPARRIARSRHQRRRRAWRARSCERAGRGCRSSFAALSTKTWTLPPQARPTSQACSLVTPKSSSRGLPSLDRGQRLLHHGALDAAAGDRADHGAAVVDARAGCRPGGARSPRS